MHLSWPKPTILILSLLLILGNGCASWNGSNKSVRCAKSKKIQTKKFAHRKKKKNTPRPVITAQTSKPQPKSAPAPPPVEVEPLSIPETKTAAFEFRGEEVDLAKSDYIYNEKIQFVSKTDVFLDMAKAREQIKDLAAVLRKNPDINVTIIGNAADPTKRTDIIYGNSEAALNQLTDVNRSEMTIKEAMLAKANRVYGLLTARGVNPAQLRVTHGTLYDNIEGRVVTFILKKE